MRKQLFALFLSAVFMGCGGGSDSPQTKIEVDPQTPSTISGTDTGVVMDRATVVANGVLNISDAQAGEATFQAQTNAVFDFGLFSISEQGEWSYQLNESDALSALTANQHIDVEIVVLSADNTAHTITITVNGVNDFATLNVGDTNVVESNTTTASSGTVVISDIDTGEGTIVSQTEFASTFGIFSINSSGEWSYTLDLTNEDVTTLAEGATLNDIISLSSDDDSTANIVFIIVGAKVDHESNFLFESEVKLDSDGLNKGGNAYTLIENAFAEGSIEAPDFYPSNHTSVKHIIEDVDDIVGAHFVFLAHRDLDHDKGGDPSDRQRNEIKSYDKSAETLKAYLNDTFQYRWKFKVSSDLQLSSRFSHFFQIKAKNFSEDNSNGNDNQPIFTLSGAEKSSSGNELQVRYNSGYNTNGDSTSDVYLSKVEWSLITDQWVEVFVQITYAEEGRFKLSLTRLSDDVNIIDIDEQNIDTWRGFGEKDFVRPKWGIYRSILETNSLRADEEQVRFANFSIKKGTLVQ